ncbi:MAG: DinB family protein [Planctomycetes bacterium]|nr:DinB family protein [Planctomycetota bacterium]
MDDPISTAIVAQWQELREVAEQLVADLTDEQMVSQPVAGVTMNHPAWVLSHLSAYAPVLAGILRGEVVEDPLSHRYGLGSQPLREASEYLSRDKLISSYTAAYDDAATAFADATPERLLQPSPFERWLTRFPTIAYLPGQFLVKHNAYHLGQLSAWRRASGLPPI